MLSDCSSSTGVVLVDSGGTGVWLLHSTPRFPCQRDKDHFWPETGTRNGQTFICITLPYGEFKHVGKVSSQQMERYKNWSNFFFYETVNVHFVLHLGKHLQYIGAWTFDHDLPPHFHQELIDAVNGKQLPAPNNFQRLTTSGDNIFRSIAKQTSPQPRGEISTSFHLKWWWIS